MNVHISLRAWMVFVLLASSLGWDPFTSAISQAESSASLLYVRSEANGACTSWYDACDLQTALNKANSGDQIWAAEGKYYPGTVVTATFQLVDGISIYGGFAGTEVYLNGRGWVDHPTILSGDIDRDGILDGDNAYHVLTIVGLGDTTILDGFTITGGYARGSLPDDSGGGILNNGSSPVLNNLTFSGNFAEWDGGGMINIGSSPVLNNVSFSGNIADGYGGGMYNDSDSSPALNNVSFSGNIADGYGGGMYNDSDSLPTLVDVRFSGNAADYGGGMFNFGSSPALTDVTFTGNFAEWDGGGMYNEYASPSLTDVTFFNNSARGYGGGMWNYAFSPPTLTNVIFSGNSADYGGGMYNLASSPMLTSSTFSGNTANIQGGGIYNEADSLPTLTNSILWGNTAIYDTISSQLYGPATIDYSDVEQAPGETYPGKGNLNADPQFVDAVGGNLRLKRVSPVIDLGDDNAVTINADLDGSPRHVDIAGTGSSLVDMGAYEVQVSAPVLFVDRDSAGTLHNGQSWSSAFPNLQTALATVITGTEVWVADGTYYPGFVKTATFHLVGGVSLYGGFSGTETALDKRSWAEHPAILSGDIDRDRIVDTENVYHVVTSVEITPSTTLDGFTITGGDANGIVPYDRGGGMYNVGSSPALTNVAFSGNEAYQCGGMYNYGSSSTLTNITFSGNSASSAGGGLCDGYSTSILTNVTFSANSADAGGGMYVFNSSPTLTNLTFSRNSAYNRGGGMYIETSFGLTLTNSILWGNTAPDGPQIYDVYSMAAATYSDIQGGMPGEGNLDADPLFIDADGGNLRLQPTSPAIDAGNNDVVTVLTDRDGNSRKVDIPAVPDTGYGAPPLVDIGAYEVLVRVILPVVLK